MSESTLNIRLRRRMFIERAIAAGITASGILAFLEACGALSSSVSTPTPSNVTIVRQHTNFGTAVRSIYKLGVVTNVHQQGKPVTLPDYEFSSSLQKLSAEGIDFIMYKSYGGQTLGDARGPYQQTAEPAQRSHVSFFLNLADPKQFNHPAQAAEMQRTLEHVTPDSILWLGLQAYTSTAAGEKPIWVASYAEPFIAHALPGGADIPTS